MANSTAFLSSFWPAVRTDDDDFFRTLRQRWPRKEPTAAVADLTSTAEEQPRQTQSANAKVRISPSTVVGAMAAIGFAAGLGGAFAYAWRKGRREAALELAQTASGPMSITSQVSRTRLSKRSAASPPVAAHAFESTPSVLRSRAAAGAALPLSPAVPPPAPSLRLATSDEEAGATGPLLAIQAFGIATGLVAITFLVTIEIGRRIWGIRDVSFAFSLAAHPTR